MVGTTGIEPVTTAMSRQCSTAELRAPIKTKPDKHSSGARKIPHAGYGSQHLPSEILAWQVDIPRFVAGIPIY